MVKSLKDNFLGKVCTILTQSCAIPFKSPMEHSQYFSGILVGVDPSGVWLKSPLYGTLAFFSFPIQGIVEETKVDPTDPRYQKIKEELDKKEKPKVAPQARPKPSQGTTPVISVDELSARLKASKKS